MQFKYIAYWVIIIDCILELATNIYYRDFGAIAFYFALLFIVFLFVYLREYSSEKKRAMMDYR
jgi:hypothetical protein